MNGRIVTDIEIVLDFVERWNKGDDEDMVAGAAARIESWLTNYEPNEEL